MRTFNHITCILCTRVCVCTPSFNIPPHTLHTLSEAQMTPQQEQRECRGPFPSGADEVNVEKLKKKRSQRCATQQAARTVSKISVLCIQDAARALTEGESLVARAGCWSCRGVSAGLARLWVRAALAGSSLPSSLGSRSRCQDGCSHRQTAFPLHLGSPRQKEIVLPHQCKRCLPLPSRATVSCGSIEKPLLWLTSFFCNHKDVKAKHKKAREKKMSKIGRNDVGLQFCPQLWR